MVIQKLDRLSEAMEVTASGKRYELLWGTLFLFLLDWLGPLKAIEKLASPVISGFLGLPARTTEAFIVGFPRTNYGATGFYALPGRDSWTPGVVPLCYIHITFAGGPCPPPSALQRFPRESLASFQPDLQPGQCDLNHGIGPMGHEESSG